MGALVIFQKLTGTINGVCLLNVVLGIGFIAALSTTSKLGGHYHDATGWISVVGASIIFGATGIPFKTPALNSVSPDPLVFAFYSSLGIFLVSLPLGVYLWCASDNNDLTFQSYQPWSILGSFDILLTTFLAFQTVQQVGYAKGPAIWATVGMVFSFVIGAVAFQETITNMVSAVLSIPSLVVGMLLIISCQESDTNKAPKEKRHEYSTVPVDVVIDEEESTSTLKPESASSDVGEIELKSFNDNTDSDEVNGDDAGHDIDTTETADRSDNENNNREGVVHSKEGNNILWGVFLGVLTGLVDGSLMVPFKMTKSKTDVETYQYLVSFGFSSLITTPLIFTLYYFYLNVSTAKTTKDSHQHDNNNSNSSPATTISKEQMELSMIPGILNGILWGLANFMSVTATFHLSMRIAFPLTQTCVLFATCWGIFYFQEIDRSKETIVKLLAGLGFFLLGTFLLAESSN